MDCLFAFTINAVYYLYSCQPSEETEMPRTKGAKNKPKRALLGLLQERYGKEFHPIMEMAKLANNPEADLSLKLNAYKELAKYISPQLKAVEHTGSVDLGLYDQLAASMARVRANDESGSK